MSRIRRVFVAIVSIVVVATAVGATANRGHHRHPPARPAAVVRSGAPVVATPPAPPSADFDARAFVNALTRVDPAIANQLIKTMSPADRAALATEIQTSVGLSAGS
jgi:hypothetical protein